MSAGDGRSAHGEIERREKPGGRYFSQLLESIEHLGWEASEQFDYLRQERLPVNELLEAYFDYGPGGFEFLTTRGYLTAHQYQSLIDFDRFLAAACDEPWEDSRDGLDDLRWTGIRSRARELLATVAAS